MYYSFQASIMNTSFFIRQRWFSDGVRLFAHVSAVYIISFFMITDNLD